MPLIKLISDVETAEAPHWVFYHPGKCRLYGLYVTSTLPYTADSCGFAVGGLISGGDTYDSVICNLVAGFLDPNTSLCWDGSILLDSEIRIFLRIRGDVGFRANMHANIEVV